MTQTTKTPAAPTTPLPVLEDAGIRYIEEIREFDENLQLEWDIEAIEGDGGGLNIRSAQLNTAADVDAMIAWLQQMRPVVEQIETVVGQ